MIYELRGMRISSISCAVPKSFQQVRDLGLAISQPELERVISTTGITQMPILDDDQTVLDLMIAATEFLRSASDKLESDFVDAIISITPTPDYSNPGNSLLLANRLNLNIKGPHFDLAYGCSGFAFGLLQSYLLIECKVAKSVLLLVGEGATRTLRKTDRTTRTLFGDSAAAILIEADPRSKITVDLGSAPKSVGCIIVEGSGARRQSAIHETGLTMNGVDLMSFIVKHVPESINRVLRHTNLTSDAIDLLVPHQASQIVLQYLKQRLGLEDYQFVNCLRNYGNTGNASMLVALCDHLAKGTTEIVNIENLVFSGFGSGLSWGSAHVSLRDCSVLNVHRVGKEKA